MTNAEIINDLDYVKTLAEEGRNTPLVGGRVGLWWGVLLCAALLIHWMIITGRIDTAPQSLALLWIGFGVIGMIGSTVLGRTLAGKPGGTSATNRTAYAIWTGNTLFLFVYGFSAGLSAGFGYNDFSIMNTMMPVAFGLYGLTAYVTSKISGERWLMIPGLIGLAFVPLSLFMLRSPNLFLVAIAGIIMTIIIPDIIHLRREPKTIV